MRYLTKDSYYIDVITSATLLYNIYKAAQSPVIGFTDANNTLRTITEKLNVGHIRITQDTLESGLWACNMLDEIGKFWHPKGLKFDDFLNRLLTKDKKFSKIYNTIEEKE